MDLNRRRQTICQNFLLRKMKNLKGYRYCKYGLQASLEPIKPLVPGTAICRNTGKTGCDIGTELGTTYDGGAFAIIGGFMQSCRA